MVRIAIAAAALALALACKRAPEGPARITVTSKSSEAVALYQRAEALSDHGHAGEAQPLLKKAVELDPDFALAHASFPSIGPEAQGHVERAAALAPSLPPAERAYVEGRVARLRGESDKAVALMKSAAAAAPGDHRPYTELTGIAMMQHRLDDAAAAALRAVELDPRSGAAHNQLGYVRMLQKKYDEAAAALRKYAELSPGEANAHDSLGEALLNSGKLAEAEASFKKAIELNPKFPAPWEGVAMARFHHGDWKGGREALAKRRELEPDPADKLLSDLAAAESLAAEGSLAEALAAFSALEKDAAAQKLDAPLGWALTGQAFVHIEADEHEAALAPAAAALELARKGSLVGSVKKGIEAGALVMRIWADSHLGKTDDALQSAAALEEVVKGETGSWRASQLHFARGLLAMAGKRAQGAVEQFDLCRADHWACQAERYRAHVDAGDHAGAEAIKKAIVSATPRSLDPLLVRSRLAHGGEEHASAEK